MNADEAIRISLEIEEDRRKLERTVGDDVSNALAVFLLDPRLRMLLEAFDPMAVKQARDALGLTESEEVYGKKKGLGEEMAE